MKVHGLGDAVMIRMLIEHLVSRDPGLQIGVLAGSPTKEVLTAGRRFTVHLYDQKKRTFFSTLMLWLDIRRGHYDAVLNFEQVSLSGTAFLSTTGIPIRAGFVLLNNSAKQSFLTHAIRFEEGESMWHSFIRLVQTLDAQFPAAPEPAPLPLGGQARRHADQWISDRLGTVDRLVALHLGPISGLYRCWPVERFVELANRLRATKPRIGVVLTGLPGEKKLATRFQLAYPGRVLDATEADSVEMTAALLNRCDLLVSNDTGIMHLGAALGVPTVGIFGPDTPRRYAPIGRMTASVYARAKCSPCINIYRGLSPLKCANPVASECLAQITVDDVMRAAEGLTFSNVALAGVTATERARE